MSVVGSPELVSSDFGLTANSARLMAYEIAGQRTRGEYSLV